MRPSRQSASSPDVDLIFKIFKRWGSVDHKQTFPPGAFADAARHSPSWATAALQASRSPFISSVASIFEPNLQMAPLSKTKIFHKTVLVNSERFLSKTLRLTCRFGESRSARYERSGTGSCTCMYPGVEVIFRSPRNGKKLRAPSHDWRALTRLSRLHTTPFFFGNHYSGRE